MTNSLSDLQVPPKFTTELEHSVITQLAHLSCYSVSGEDATAFLQGQLTNDVAEVTATKGQLTSYCTPKGRMLAIFYLCSWQDNYLIYIPSEIAANVMQRLQMYIMRSKVTITEEADLDFVGLIGTASTALTKNLGFTPPSDDYQVAQSADGLCMQLPGVTTRYLLCGKQELLTMLTNQLADNTQVYAESYWQWLDIASGIPSISSNTQEAFVPQMANMELIEGVSFSKGCYPGQEVVARLHYLGSANRRMYRFSVVSDTDINPGDKLYRTDSDNSQAIGNVVSVVQEDTTLYSGLAVLRVEAAQHKISLTSPEGTQIKLLTLPYAIPANKENDEST